MFPTIHLNGTAKHVLYDQLAHALNQVREARYALMEACPNGRDYYPQGQGAISQATAEHVARLAKLEAVEDELTLILAHVASTKGDR